MALGPKAMGEAILANLESKTGKDLEQWRAELERSGLTSPVEARQYLQGLGLGRFQALTVVERVLAQDPYADERRLVDDHFARHPEQRALYDLAVAELTAAGLCPKPCRGYLPLYRDKRIAVSFKSTARGLYAALNLADASKWPERVAHRLSLGGSARLQDGLYISSRSVLQRLVRELKPTRE